MSHPKMRMQVFNKEKVARTVFETSTPVITGVWHREDKTLAGYLADFRCITPTEAGEEAVQKKTKLEGRLKEFEKQLSETFEKFKKIKKQEKKSKKEKE